MSSEVVGFAEVRKAAEDQSAIIMGNFALLLYTLPLWAEQNHPNIFIKLP